MEELIKELVKEINNVGFPIIACIFMANQQIKLSNVITDMTTTLKNINTRLEIIERNCKINE